MNRVREVRKDVGLTQVQLARRSGIAERTVCTIERGGSCRQGTRRKILKGLGLDWSDRVWVWNG